MDGFLLCRKIIAMAVEYASVYCATFIDLQTIRGREQRKTKRSYLKIKYVGKSLVRLQGNINQSSTELSQGRRQTFRIDPLIYIL